MISSYMNYGALSAKVRALYGKRLRHADFEHMAALTDPRDIFDFLRAQPGWSAALAPLGVGTEYVGRIELEEALRSQLRHEYRGLSHFLPKDDKALVSFPVRLNELEDIMLALRRLKSGDHKTEGAPPTLLPDAKVDRKALSACADYGGLVAAAKGSIYYQSLLHLQPQGADALPDYITAEALLHSAYFSHMYKAIHKCYAGQTQKILLRAFGEQIDLLNLIHILRLKTYFPGESRYYSVIFPFNYRLRPEKVQALCESADAAGVFALLSDTPYAKALDGIDLTVAGLEDYYRRAFYVFNKRQLTTGEPSVYTAMAYLNLKELEFQALINVIESVKYGVPYDNTFACLAGE